jgi:hypothetical protein
MTYERVMRSDGYEEMEPCEAIRSYMEDMFDIYFKHRALIGMDMLQSATVAQASNILTLEVIQSLSRIIRRGQAAGVFRADADAARFFCYSMALVAGIVSFADSMSRLTARDFHSQKGMNDWRDFCADSGVRILFCMPDIVGDEPN